MNKILKIALAIFAGAVFLFQGCQSFNKTEDHSLQIKKQIKLIPCDVAIECKEQDEAQEISIIQEDFNYANSLYAELDIAFYIRNVFTVEYVEEYDKSMEISTVLYNKFNCSDGILVVYGYSNPLDSFMGMQATGTNVFDQKLRHTIKINTKYRELHVLAHEFAHAFDLGHSFENKEKFDDVKSYDDINISLFDYYWLNQNLMNCNLFGFHDFSNQQKNFIKNSNKFNEFLR